MRSGIHEFGGSAGLAPQRWRRIRAINGRGTLLLGPDEHGTRAGAMVIAPPGVLLRGPEGSEPLTRNGWRQARWVANRDGTVLVDQARPKALMEVGIAQVVEDLAAWAPEHLVWVAEIVERNIRILLGRMRRDWRGELEVGFEHAYDDLTELHREADEAFGRVRDRDVPDWLTDGHFSRMRHAYLITLRHDRAAFLRTIPRPSANAMLSHELWLRPVPNPGEQPPGSD